MATAEPLNHHGAVPSDSFALRLRALRFDLGRLSVEDAAERCGFKTATWSTWENGALPRNQGKVVRQIAERTGYDPAWLMWGGPLATSGYKSQTAGEAPILTLVDGSGHASQRPGERQIFPMAVPPLNDDG